MTAPAYIDSSVLLSILLKDAHAEKAAAIWDAQSIRVSSLLLGAECWVSLRRYAARLGRAVPAGWLEERGRLFRDALASIELKPFDAEILDVLRDEPGLAQCRTLDAVHLATALFFRGKADAGIALVTFDAQMREVASRLGIAALPA